jgi:hypothetical protein
LHGFWHLCLGKFWPRNGLGALDQASPQANCLAALRLEDGTLVHLQPTWQVEALRSVEELQKFRDKSVVVTGLLAPEMPAPPSNIAYIKGPCLFGTVSILDRSTWNSLQGGKIDWNLPKE